MTYIDLQEADQNLESTKKYAQLSAEFCRKHEHTYWINLIDCTKITRYIDRQIREIEDLRLLVRQLTRNKDEERIRFKKGVFNFRGGISKILFKKKGQIHTHWQRDKVHYQNIQKIKR